jgi:hypothetical protein
MNNVPDLIPSTEKENYVTCREMDGTGNSFAQ